MTAYQRLPLRATCPFMEIVSFRPQDDPAVGRRIGRSAIAPSREEFGVTGGAALGVSTFSVEGGQAEAELRAAPDLLEDRVALRQSALCVSRSSISGKVESKRPRDFSRGWTITKMPRWRSCELGDFLGEHLSALWGARVLDAGYGPGVYMDVTAKRAAGLTALDITVGRHDRVAPAGARRGCGDVQALPLR